MYACKLALSMSRVSDKVSVSPVKLKRSRAGAPCSKDTATRRSAEPGHSPSSDMSEACSPPTASSRHSSRSVDTVWAVTMLDAVRVRLWQPCPSFSTTLSLSVMLWGVIPLSTDEFATRRSSRWIVKETFVPKKQIKEWNVCDFFKGKQ